jgi:hypothetical protein
MVVGVVVFLLIGVGVTVMKLMEFKGDLGLEVTTLASFSSPDRSNPTETLSTNQDFPTTIQSSTIQPSSLKPTTTVLPQESFEIVPKSKWNSVVVGTDPLKTPVARVIVLETITNQCSDREICLKFLKQRQVVYLNRFIGGILMENLPENFLISSDGTIYEGRGFFEGQHTYDQGETSYNRKSLGISFLVESSSDKLTERQAGAFEFLTKNFLTNRKLRENFDLYHRVQLAGGSESAIYEQVTTMSHWKESLFLS